MCVCLFAAVMLGLRDLLCNLIGPPPERVSMSRGWRLINGKCSFCEVRLADQTSRLPRWKSVAVSHAAPTQAATLT